MKAGTLTRIAAAATVLISAALLTGCTGSQPTGAEAAGGSGAASAEQVTLSVALDDGWAKSAEADGMTGVFGTLRNHTDRDLVITGVTSDAAEHVELHEVTAEGQMQEVSGDVVIPADGSFELVPGGNHVMLMGLTRALLAGDEVTFTLSFDDGSSHEFTVLVKDYSGANEEYGDAEHSDADHGGTDPSGASHEDHVGH